MNKYIINNIFKITKNNTIKKWLTKNFFHNQKNKKKR